MRSWIFWLLVLGGGYLGLRAAGCVGERDAERARAEERAEESSPREGDGPTAEEAKSESPRMGRAVDAAWVDALLARETDRPPASAPAGVVERWGRLRSEDPVERWRAWSALLEEGLVPEERRAQYLEELERFARRALRSEALSFEVVVRPGDALVKIARRVRREHGIPVSVGLIRWLNGLRGDLIHPGQKLRIPRDPVRIDVIKSQFLLRVRIDGGIVREFAVGIGREDKTPEGTWTLEDPLEHPPWKDPESGKIYVWGDPEYAIGTRWIGFGGEGKALGLGIHGTNEPDSIGKAASLGCIRMRNEDVEKLADWIARGVQVEVVE